MPGPGRVAVVDGAWGFVMVTWFGAVQVVVRVEPVGRPSSVAVPVMVMSIGPVEVAVIR